MTYENEETRVIGTIGMPGSSGPNAPAGIVRWEAPPTRGSAPYQDTATTLANKPGEWALVDEQIDDTKPNVTAWRRHLGVLLDGKAEVREVTVNGQTRVYARRKPLQDGEA